MKKVSILLVSLLILVGCSFQKSELDKELLELINVEAIQFDYEEKGDGMFYHIITVKDEGVYFSRWLNEDREVNSGVLRIKDGEKTEIIKNEDLENEVENFIKVDDKLYYSSYKLRTSTESTELGAATYDIHLYDGENNESVLNVDKDEEVVNAPELFKLNNKLFTTLQLANESGEVRATIYNITDQKEVFSIRQSELSEHSDFILKETTRGLDEEALTFAITRQKGDNVISSIYTFDGKDMEENVYNDIYIYDLLMVQGQAMFNYNKNTDDGRYIGYLNKDEDLVQTEIPASTLLKVLDVKEGSIIYGSVGSEASEMYHYVEIKDMDIAFESVSIFDDSALKEKTLSEFYTINDESETKTIINRYTLK